MSGCDCARDLGEGHFSFCITGKDERIATQEAEIKALREQLASVKAAAQSVCDEVEAYRSKEARRILNGEQLARMPVCGLTFDQFRAANVTRCLKWHPEGIESWSDSDWLVAVMGELGELASLIKMRNRERDGLSGNKFSPTDEDIAKEGADVVTYLDLFLARNNIDMGLWAALKFNEVSERVGFPDHITIYTNPAPQEKQG